MKAEIISTGTELLLGQTLNTNAYYLTWKLSSLGMEVDYHTTVGDNPERLEVILRQALERSDLVITTGGTGTTADDLTKRIAAKILGVEMILDEECLSEIERFFLTRNKLISAEDRELAYIPEGAQVLSNKHGTAPGIVVKYQTKYLIILPGPPAEMQPMFEQKAWTILQNIAGPAKERMYVRVLKVFGIDEKGLEKELGFLSEVANPTLTLLSKHTEMHIRMVARTKDPVEANKRLEQLEGKIRAKLGLMVYGKDDESLVGIVNSLLKKRRVTLSTAESCTGGLLGGMLTQQPGSSAVFWGGVISYDNSVKEQLLGVDPDLIRAVGAVSPEVAKAMASGIRQRIGTDLGIGITGIAGPDGGTEQKPVGLVYIGFASKHGIEVKKFQFMGERESIRQLAVHHALNMIRQYMLSFERSSLST